MMLGHELCLPICEPFSTRVASLKLPHYEGLGSEQQICNVMYKKSTVVSASHHTFGTQMTLKTDLQAMFNTDLYGVQAT